jgi:lipoprotein-anchoring transpeptidase ErfK/SrfK
MRPHAPTPLRRAAAVALLALTSACGVVGPSPHRRDADAARAPVPPPDEYLVLKLAERRLYLMDDDPATALESFPIVVGREGRETPTGRYRVEEKVEYPHYDKIDPTDRTRIVKRIPPGPQNPLGERWIGIIVGDGWTIGIHGTPNPELLGKAVSGGCIRMRNADVIRVYDRVEIGTPVIVEP